MGSKVYFTDMGCRIGDSLLDKLERVVRAAGICDIDMERKFVAIKLHFGEYGNLSFLRPNYAKVVADIVRENGGMPFLTDCNTLYVGRRKHALEHMDTANLNGYGPMTTGCQIIIADGLKGTDDVEVPIDGEYVKNAKIGRAIVDSDVLISLSHFKCHEQTGYGGALKNLAMGCGSRRGKLEMHAAGKPSVDPDACRSCGRCIGFCAESAISMDGMQIESDPRSQQVFAKPACLTRLRDRFFEPLINRPDFAVDIDIPFRNPHGICRDQHALDHGMRIVPENVTVLERPRLALVRIADEIHLILVAFRHEPPFQRRRKTGAAPSAQSRIPHFGDDFLRRHPFGKDTPYLAVSTPLNIIGQRPVVARQSFQQHRLGMAVMQAGHYFSSSSSLSILSLVMRIYICLLFTRTTGPSPHAPMHSLSTSV